MTLLLQEIPIEQIRPSPHNPRIFRDRDAELASLADSIRSVGVLHPVLVRPVHAVNGDGAAYELIAGERRWRAAKLAGVAVIPATVRSDLDDQQALELHARPLRRRRRGHRLMQGEASEVKPSNALAALQRRVRQRLGRRPEGPAARRAEPLLTSDDNDELERSVRLLVAVRAERNRVTVMPQHVVPPLVVLGRFFHRDASWASMAPRLRNLHLFRLPTVTKLKRSMA